jgi:hypothetical protein
LAKVLTKVVSTLKKKQLIGRDLRRGTPEENLAFRTKLPKPNPVRRIAAGSKSALRKVRRLFIARVWLHAF